jgi:hypothetical protein
VLWVPEEYATAQELADDLRRFLADMLHKQRQWEDARRLREEVLGRRRKVLGEDHPDTLYSTHNLAIALQPRRSGSEPGCCARRFWGGGARCWDRTTPTRCPR